MKHQVALTLALTMVSGVAAADHNSGIIGTLYQGAGSLDATTQSLGVGDFNFEGQSRALIQTSGTGEVLSSGNLLGDSLSTGRMSGNDTSNDSAAGVENGLINGLTEATVNGSQTTIDAIIDGQDVLFESLNRTSGGATMPIGEIGDEIAAELRNGQQQFAANGGQDEFSGAVSGNADADADGNAEATDDEGDRGDFDASEDSLRADADAFNEEGTRSNNNFFASENQTRANSGNRANGSESVSFFGFDSGS